MKKKVEDLEKTLLDKQKEIDDLKEKLASFGNKIGTDLDADNQKLLDKIQEMEKSLADKQKALEENQAKLKAAQDEAGKL